MFPIHGNMEVTDSSSCEEFTQTVVETSDRESYEVTELGLSANY